ncbi:MAG: dipeptidase [Acidobacteriota bacterium]
MKLRILLICTFITMIILPLIGSGDQDRELLEKARGIHEKILTVDTHTDTPMMLRSPAFDIGRSNNPRKRGGKVDFPRMKEGGLDAIFFAAFVGQGPRTPEGREKAKQNALSQFKLIKKAVSDYPELAELAVRSSDAAEIEKKGKRAIFIGIENGYPVGTDISLVNKFYDLGGRYITLCHTRNNDICDSSTDRKGEEHGGLSEFGKRVVKEMNRIGMIVDVSHISDKSFYDVLRTSEAPVIASHSCARAICDNPRNLSDDMLKLLAEKKGVIQLCILSEYVKKPKPYPARDNAFKKLRTEYENYSKLSEKEKEKVREKWYELNRKYPRELASVSDAVNHIDHIVKIAGIDHVGIGTDFDGGGALSDCYDSSELWRITYELVKRGYSEEDIRKIWGGNFFRVFKAIEDHSKNKKE